MISKTHGLDRDKRRVLARVVLGGCSVDRVLLLCKIYQVLCIACNRKLEAYQPDLTHKMTKSCRSVKSGAAAAVRATLLWLARDTGWLPLIELRAKSTYCKLGTIPYCIYRRLWLRYRTVQVVSRPLAISQPIHASSILSRHHQKARV